jgi:hypothetical protein
MPPHLRVVYSPMAMQETPPNVTERIAALESALVRLRQQLDTVTADLKAMPGSTSLVIQRVNVMKLIMVAQSEIDRLQPDPKNK